MSTNAYKLQQLRKDSEYQEFEKSLGALAQSKEYTESLTKDPDSWKTLASVPDYGSLIAADTASWKDALKNPSKIAKGLQSYVKTSGGTTSATSPTAQYVVPDEVSASMERNPYAYGLGSLYDVQSARGNLQAMDPALSTYLDNISYSLEGSERAYGQAERSLAGTGRTLGQMNRSLLASDRAYNDVEAWLQQSGQAYGDIGRQIGRAETAYGDVERRIGAAGEAYGDIERRIADAEGAYGGVERRLQESDVAYGQVEDQIRRSGQAYADVDEAINVLESANQAYLRGELPKDVLDQIRRSSSEKIQQSGVGGQMADARSARDLGLTSLQLQEAGLQRQAGLIDAKRGQFQAGLALADMQRGQFQSRLAQAEMQRGQFQSRLALTDAATSRLQSGMALAELQRGQLQSGLALSEAERARMQSGLAQAEMTRGQFQSRLAQSEAYRGALESQLAVTGARTNLFQSRLAQAEAGRGLMAAGLELNQSVLARESFLETNRQYEQNYQLQSQQFMEDMRRTDLQATEMDQLRRRFNAEQSLNMVKLVADLASTRAQIRAQYDIAEKSGGATNIPEITQVMSQLDQLISSVSSRYGQVV